MEKYVLNIMYLLTFWSTNTNQYFSSCFYKDSIYKKGLLYFKNNFKIPLWSPKTMF